MNGERESLRRLLWSIPGWAIFCAAVMLVFIPEFPSLVKEGAARAVKPGVVDAAPSAEKKPTGFRAETPVARRIP